MPSRSFSASRRMVAASFLEDKLLRIITKLNAEEVLFSTIYFLEGGGRPRTTWWGNYDKEYICFRDKK